MRIGNFEAEDNEDKLTLPKEGLHAKLCGDSFKLKDENDLVGKNGSRQSKFHDLGTAGAKWHSSKGEEVATR